MLRSEIGWRLLMASATRAELDFGSFRYVNCECWERAGAYGGSEEGWLHWSTLTAVAL